MICDPACGTGGFLLAAHDFIRKDHKLDKAGLRFLNTEQLRGVELVDSVARLCSMNLLLHGIGATAENGTESAYSRAGEGRARRQARRIRAGADESTLRQEEQRDDCQRRWRDEQRKPHDQPRRLLGHTSNKQLNFLQHVFTILKQHGRAAVVVPDNVLILRSRSVGLSPCAPRSLSRSPPGGSVLRRRRRRNHPPELLNQADVHTLLRLPTGIFYAQGVKANVLFFDRKPAADKQAWTTKLWIYDLRTNKHFTLKENPLKRADLDDFVACYSAKDRTKRDESECWNSFTSKSCSSVTR